MQSEYITGSCKNTNPTQLQTSANTTPGLSFLCDGLKRFSEDEYTCLPGIFPNFTLKELLQILQLSLGRLSNITSLSYSLARFLFRTKLTNTRVNVFVGSKFLASGRNKIDVHWLFAHFRKGGQAVLIRGRSMISQALQAGVISSAPPPSTPPTLTGQVSNYDLRWRQRKPDLSSVPLQNNGCTAGYCVVGFCVCLLWLVRTAGCSGIHFHRVVSGKDVLLGQRMLHQMIGTTAIC